MPTGAKIGSCRDCCIRRLGILFSLNRLGETASSFGRSVHRNALRRPSLPSEAISGSRFIQMAGSDPIRAVDPDTDVATLAERALMAWP